MSALPETLLRAMVANSLAQAGEVLDLRQYDLALTHLREAVEQVELMKLTAGMEPEDKQIKLNV